MDSLVHCFIDWLLQWLIASVVHWFIASLVSWFVGSLVHRFIASLPHWLTHSLTHGFSGLWTTWFIGLLLYWLANSLGHCFIDSLIHWFMPHWFLGSSVPWFIGSFKQLCMDSFISFHWHLSHHLLVRWCSSLQHVIASATQKLSYKPRPSLAWHYLVNSTSPYRFLVWTCWTWGPGVRDES